MSEKYRLSRRGYALGLVYLVSIAELTAFVTILDTPHYGLGIAILWFSALFSLVGIASRGIIMAKLFPLVGFFIAFFISPAPPRFQQILGGYETFLVRLPSALLLSLLISVAIFHISTSVFGCFIQTDKPVPPAVTRFRLSFTLFLLIALTVNTFSFNILPEYRFTILAAVGLVFLFGLYDAAFTHILHMESRRRLTLAAEHRADFDRT
ncbi:MAG: hypothetical protein CMJ46_09230 [Planctomyces sp.]|nr:hypothetical protein [Planctomyces sp.]